MPNEIYHRSEWGNPKAEGFGDVYFDAAATNKLYNHSDNYENSDGTDKILRDIPNKASIVLTPTAYSDGSLNTVIPPYQVLPTELVTNGTFDTDSDWTKTNAAISGGVATITVVGGAYSRIIQNITYQSGKIYKLTAQVQGTSGKACNFFDNGSNIGGLTTSNGIVNFDGSVQKVYIEWTANANSDAILCARSGTGNFEFTIDNVSVKEVTDADFQFSRGSSATRVNEKGLIEDVASNIPRIDYTSGQGALLLEPQSTNLITYSEDFSQWTSENFTSNSETTIAPNGDTVGGYDFGDGFIFINTANLDGSSDYTNSIYIKANKSATIGLRDGGAGSSSNNTDINLTTNWVRFTATSTSTITTDGRLLLDNRAINGYGVSDLEVFIWGTQLEAGSYPTSYIPTSGSTVTRSADVANNSGNADLFNDSEGVLYAEIAALADDNTNRIFGISDGGDFNNSVLLRFSSSSNRIQAQVRLGGVYQCSLNYDVTDATEFNKIAFKYKQNDFSLFVNGIERATDTSGNVITGLDVLDFDISTANEFYGNVKSLAVFKEALTYAELESLTSWVSFVEMATDLEYTIE